MRFLLLSAFVGVLFASTTAHAQSAPADPYLAAGVQALADGDAALGLQLLDLAATRTDDPRLTYYRAFALEKLGRCAEARRAYRAAQDLGPAEFANAARGAMDGFDARCVPAKPVTDDRPAVREVTEVRRAAPAAVSLGLIVSTVGAMALLGVPVKHALDRQVARTSEEYFKRAYDCDVSGGELGAGCDAAVVEADAQWSTYERRNAAARTSTIALAVGGTGLLAAGVIAITFGSRRVAVSAGPQRGGAAVVLRTTF